MTSLGVRRPRIDGLQKVTGEARYAGDLPVPGMLHARIVPSLYAHARILGIDASAARALPGVVAVLTAEDLPIVGRGASRRYEPLVRTEAVFAGQPVALVVAESEAVAEDAAALVVVDAEPLPPFLDVLAAGDPGAPRFRLAPQPGTAPGDDPADGNVFSRRHDQRGDLASAFAGSDVIVEARFGTSWAYQAYLEPHAAAAWIEPGGTLIVSCGTQSLFFTRNELAKIYGLPASKVRVIAATLGGGFGSKQVVIEPLVAGAALRLRRPVRLVLTRREDFASTKPAQALAIDLRIGARNDGQLGALEARLTYDAGAYTESSWDWFAAQLITGPYRWPAYDVHALGVRTNRFGAGNYRAPTGPQGVFALESLLDELAGRLGIDPIDLRIANLVGEGDLMADDEPWPAIGARECLARLREHPVWTGRHGLAPGEGVGLAIGVWPGTMEPAAAVCRLEPDGTISVITGVVDISGSASGLAVIAAETFGVDVGSVTIVTADSASAPPSPGSNASAITYGAGPAVRGAAAEARDRLLRFAAEAFEIKPDDLEIVDGVVRPRGSPELGRPLAELALEASESYSPPIVGHGATDHSVIAPSAAAHLAHVRVDEETGSVEVLDYAVAQDVGRALNPALVEGQMMGGTVQGIGLALCEQLIHDGQGQLVTGSFLDYAVPRAAMLPPIDTLIVEVAAPEGPFGAKGIGEASILPGPAAIANAIAAATGTRLRQLPITPARVWAAAQHESPGAAGGVDDPAGDRRAGSTGGRSTGRSDG